MLPARRQSPSHDRAQHPPPLSLPRQQVPNLEQLAQQLVCRSPGNGSGGGGGGVAVDWWVLLKFPAGQQAAYLDSEVVRQQQQKRLLEREQDQERQFGPNPGETGSGSSSSESIHESVVAGGGDGSGGDGLGSRRGSGRAEDGATCTWRLRVDVNDPDGPLRASLAPAAAAAAMAATASERTAVALPGVSVAAAAASPATPDPGKAVTVTNGTAAHGMAAPDAAAPSLPRCAPWTQGLRRLWTWLLDTGAGWASSPHSLSPGVLQRRGMSRRKDGGGAGAGAEAAGDGGTDRVRSGNGVRHGNFGNDNEGGGGDGGIDGGDGGNGGTYGVRYGGGVSDGEGRLGYAFYNDADPEGMEHWGFAHAKGVLLFGPGGGIWISHSFPSYPGHPPRTSVGAAGPGAGGPDVAAAGRMEDAGEAGVKSGGCGSSDAGDGGANGDGGAQAVDWDVVRRAQTVYGQHALCLTLTAESVEAVAESLLVAKAYVYDYVLPPDLAEQYGAVQDLIDASSAEPEVGPSREHNLASGNEDDGRTDGADGPDASGANGRRRRASTGPVPHWQRQPPPPSPPPPDRNTSERFISTSGGALWLHVTKSPNHTVPFHEQVLEPLLRSDMAWETWRLGASYHSECPPDTPYGSYNVRHVSVPTCGGTPNNVGAAEGRGPGVAAAGDKEIEGGAAHEEWYLEAGRGGAPVAGTNALHSMTRPERAAPGAGADYRWGCGRVGGSATTRGSVGVGAADWDSLKDHSKWGISAAGLGPSRGYLLGSPRGNQNPLQEPIQSASPLQQALLSPFQSPSSIPSPEPPPTRWVCLGDLNRQPSQRYRGGGYVCAADPAMWEAFRELVAEVEPCAAGPKAAEEEGDL